MEKRLLEKLLFDKRRELEMYDKQLEEYMRLSTQRAASGTTPLVPGGRAAWAVPALGAGSAASLAAGRPPVPSAARGGVPSQKEVLQKLLAEKQLELQRASSDADTWAAEQEEEESYSDAAASVASLPMDDRVRSLEEMLAAELARKEEQIALNEELVRLNEEQVRANQELLRKLQASQALASAAASAAGSDDDGAPQPTYNYTVGDPAPAKAAAPKAAAPKAAPAPKAAAAVEAKEDDIVLVQEDDGTQVLYRKLGRVLERPGGLGVVALGLVSSIPSAVAGAVNSIGSTVQKSETTRIKRQ